MLEIDVECEWRRGEMQMERGSYSRSAEGMGMGRSYNRSVEGTGREGATIGAWGTGMGRSRVNGKAERLPQQQSL